MSTIQGVEVRVGEWVKLGGGGRKEGYLKDGAGNVTMVDRGGDKEGWGEKGGEGARGGAEMIEEQRRGERRGEE
eukprot:767208-Hanusia_phi.AAC.1